MSNYTNDTLLERANELLEEVDSHPGHLDDLLEAAIKSNDLEQIRYWVSIVEGALAQVHFYENNLIDGKDEH